MFFTYVLAGALVLSVLAKDRHERPLGHDQRRVTIVTRIGSLLLFAAGCVLVALGIYIVWSLPHGSIVNGLQGRYFLPLLPLLFVGLLPPHNDLVAGQRHLKIALVCISSLCLLVMTGEVYAFLYRPALLPNW